MCWANPARYERPPGFRPLWDRHGTARYREFSGPRVPGCPPDVQDVRYAGSGRAVAPRPRWPETHGVPRLDYPSLCSRRCPRGRERRARSRRSSCRVVFGEDPVHLLIAHKLAPIRRGDPGLDLGDLPGAQFDVILERLLHKHVSWLVGLPGEFVNRTDRRRLDVKGHRISHGSPQALLNVGEAPRHFYRCTPIIAVRPPSTGSVAPVM